MSWRALNKILSQGQQILNIPRREALDYAVVQYADHVTAFHQWRQNLKDIDRISQMTLVPIVIDAIWLKAKGFYGIAGEDSFGIEDDDAITTLCNCTGTVDNRDSSDPKVTPEQAVRLCDRNFGIGADGVIFALPGINDTP
ncbi:hypothetical protein ACLB2K_052958 [Fragaria x ananassa]